MSGVPHTQFDAKDDGRASVGTRVIRANRSNTVASTVVIITAILACALSAAAVIYTRPTHVANGALVDTSLHPVGTAEAMYIAENLETLPQGGAFFNYLSIESLILAITNPDTGRNESIGATPTGFHWYNSTDMDLFLNNDLTLHISAGTLLLAPTERTTMGVTPSETRSRRKLCVWNPSACAGAVAGWLATRISYGKAAVRMLSESGPAN